MIRALNLAFLGLTIVICFGLYRVTQTAQEREADLRNVERSIAEGERAIGVLKAEWTHLSQPAKMQAMATRYLGLEPMKPQQIAYVNDIPMRAEGEATLADVAALPFAPGAGEQPVMDETAPLPRVKPASLAR